MTEEAKPNIIKIMSRYGGVLREVEADTLRLALEKEVRSCANLSGANLSGANLSCANLSVANLSGANLSCANLSGANLSGTDLYGANLYGANLYGADLSGTDLSGANLSGADLSGANLSGADLSGADLSCAKINWQSHVLIAELLKRAAGDDVQKRMVAGLVAISTDWCWDQFLAIETDMRDWALDELSKWVTDDDDAPTEIRSRVKPVEPVAKPKPKRVRKPKATEEAK